MAAPREKRLGLLLACWVLWLRCSVCSESQGEGGRGACGCSASRGSGGEGAARKYSREGNAWQEPKNDPGTEEEEEGRQVVKASGQFGIASVQCEKGTNASKYGMLTSKRLNCVFSHVDD
ncbi:hypothetical protein JD844_012990 [Phrynosoma platyrhinos]|uniref:Uncharacterized protein n=1 Tax=Phrynosoma platyrhinos TaxID=52577 RepID=A0ABQ7TKM1_PHRPL|nr:hypothetical protein JD844_012990 [Phrynosoma platyrhinos]